MTREQADTLLKSAEKREQCNDKIHHAPACASRVLINGRPAGWSCDCKGNPDAFAPIHKAGGKP